MGSSAMCIYIPRDGEGGQWGFPQRAGGCLGGGGARSLPSPCARPLAPGGGCTEGTGLWGSEARAGMDMDLQHAGCWVTRPACWERAWARASVREWACVRTPADPHRASVRMWPGTESLGPDSGGSSGARARRGRPACGRRESFLDEAGRGPRVYWGPADSNCLSESVERCAEAVTVHAGPALSHGAHLYPRCHGG